MVSTISQHKEIELIANKYKASPTKIQNKNKRTTVVKKWKTLILN